MMGLFLIIVFLAVLFASVLIVKPTARKKATYIVMTTVLLTSSVISAAVWIERRYRDAMQHEELRATTAIRAGDLELSNTKLNLDFALGYASGTFQGLLQNKSPYTLESFALRLRIWDCKDFEAKPCNNIGETVVTARGLGISPSQSQALTLPCNFKGVREPAEWGWSYDFTVIGARMEERPE